MSDVGKMDVSDVSGALFAVEVVGFRVCVTGGGGGGDVELGGGGGGDVELGGWQSASFYIDC